MKTEPTANTVRDAFGSAQDHARSLAGPPPAWRAARARRRSRRWLGLAAFSIVAGGGLGWAWVASLRPAPALTTVEEAVVRGAPPGAGTVPRASESPPAALPAAPALAVTRQSGVIRMELSDAPLAAAVKALAEATRTTIRGGDVLLALTTERTTLHWEGTSPVAAWDALLGKVANTAVSCSAAACELWIVGSNAARRGVDAPAGVPANATPPAAQPARLPTAPILVPQPEPQDTETN